MFELNELMIVRDVLAREVVNLEDKIIANAHHAIAIDEMLRKKEVLSAYSDKLQEKILFDTNVFDVN